MYYYSSLQSWSKGIIRENICFSITSTSLFFRKHDRKTAISNQEFCYQYQQLFSDCFSFHKADYSSEESKSHYCNCLDNIMFTTSSEPSTVMIISNTSIKKNVAISITHIHYFNNYLMKILYHAINITTMEVELFAIRCRINQATQIPGTSCIIIITDTLYIAQKNSI